jgi:hypothetical protein
MTNNLAATPKAIKTPKPEPDWGRRGTQPKGTLGPPPKPNGKAVATQPKSSN